MPKPPKHPPPTVIAHDTYPFHGRYVVRARGLKRLLFWLLPRHVGFPLWLELQTTLLRLRTLGTPRRYRHARDLWLNLGAGNKGHAGWINVDIAPLPGINCVYDCRRHLPFPTQSAAAIFCEHFFEHLDYTEEVPVFLSECRRVLQPGGVLRLIVPDTERYLHAYTHGRWEPLRRLRSMGPDNYDPYLNTPYHTRMELINAVFRQGHEHKFAYDYETLAYVLQQAGFRRICRQQFGVSQRAGLAIDLPQRAPESLYVEAIP